MGAPGYNIKTFSLDRVLSLGDKQAIMLLRVYDTRVNNKGQPIIAIQIETVGGKIMVDKVVGSKISIELAILIERCQQK